MQIFILFLSCIITTASFALPPDATRPLLTDKFRSLEEILPTPNAQRTASGAPGHRYWQQQVDHDIAVEINDETQTLTGSEKITYHNNSPDTLSYLWLQLDANLFSKDADHRTTTILPTPEPGTSPLSKLSYKNLQALLLEEKFDGGTTIDSITDTDGKKLSSTVVKTMMRVDLPNPLKPGATTTLKITWHYHINDGTLLSDRTGYEYFKKDKNYIYEIANWYPRLCPYTDVNGWENKQYLDIGEFALEFGNYVVSITVPNDHIVSASGSLQNIDSVLTPTQRQRFKEAATAKTPRFIVTPEEAKANESHQPTGKKTWVFQADNIRAFAFASSRKFIWDAQGVPPSITEDPTKPVMAMSFYPKEAEPLWSKYSTQAIIHTLEVYSEHTFPYPYPTVSSVNGSVDGMEYSMISFSSPRPEEDGTYSKEQKYNLISVIIHEVGHNYFPMIVNSDERRWAWMDEGLNTFLEYLASERWEKDYPAPPKRGEPRDLVEYMKGTELVPIMTASDSLLKVAGSAYIKPSTGLNILRETIVGRQLFDFAFKTFANRWRFKRPEPADFFRTMNDATGMDLDWFWRGWFYTVDPCDISIDQVHQYILDTGDPKIDKPLVKKEREAKPETISHQRNAHLPKYVERHPELNDFYTTYDEDTVTPEDQKKFQDLLKNLEKEHIDPQLLSTKRNFYVIDFSNLGGMVMPLILKIDYTDGTTEELRIPATIWRTHNDKLSKLIMTNKEIKSLELDPHEETPDINRDNNYWPRRMTKAHFKLYQKEAVTNPMQIQKQ